MSDMTEPSNSETLLAIMVKAGPEREWSIAELEAALLVQFPHRFRAATQPTARRATKEAVLKLCGQGEIYCDDDFVYRLARVQPPLPRQPAAIHIRARDLRAGDVVDGEGKLLGFQAAKISQDCFRVDFGRDLDHLELTIWPGSKLVLVVIDGEA